MENSPTLTRSVCTLKDCIIIIELYFHFAECMRQSLDTQTHYSSTAKSEYILTQSLCAHSSLVLLHSVINCFWINAHLADSKLLHEYNLFKLVQIICELPFEHIYLECVMCIAWVSESIQKNQGKSDESIQHCNHNHVAQNHVNVLSSILLMSWH